MEHTMTFTLGDWSDDGHGKTSTYTIIANMSAVDVGKAYKKAMAATGIKPHDDWACGYEETDYAPQKLIDAGIPRDIVRHDNTDSDDTDEWRMWDGDHFVNLTIAFCKLGNPNLEMGIAPQDSTPLDLRQHLNVTHYEQYGYGLFH